MKRLLLSLLFLLAGGAVAAQPAYDFSKLNMENLGRGVVAIRSDPSTVVVSWRYLSSDPIECGFNIYRDGVRLNDKPVSGSTMFTDSYVADKEAVYEVRQVLKGRETGHKDGRYTLAANSPIGYLEIPLQRPADGVTPSGGGYTYFPNDAAVCDVDGDGEYEIILKWDPSNSRDNSQDGYTGEVFIDCYRLSGECLWRIGMGKNIRAGAHYTQFLCYDFDNDGRAEIVMRTADGTVDGIGNVIGDPSADYREPGTPKSANDPQLKNQGRIFDGKEYLTVFSGLTGEALHTVDYIPQRGAVTDWGDNYGNRCDRFLAAVAYLDGVKPSIVMSRGYYTRIVVAAFDWDGTLLSERWVFDTNDPGNEAYAGQGNHNLRIGDVDGDGCDEIVFGSCTINNDGTGLYSTGLGHGDAIHLMNFDPSDSKMQVWACHENKSDGSTFRDAATGEILFQIPSSDDVGRCMAADIDPTNYGVEMWSSRSGGIRDMNGNLLTENIKGIPINMSVWWDGDLLREMLDKTEITKYNWREKRFDRVELFEGVASNNSTKATPGLQGDILGDWREEIIFSSTDRNSLRIYVSTIPTEYRFHTFLEDPVYRTSLAMQNVGYNMPTQPGFYFGPDLRGTFRGYTFKDKR